MHYSCLSSFLTVPSAQSSGTLCPVKTQNNIHVIEIIFDSVGAALVLDLKGEGQNLIVYKSYI